MGTSISDEDIERLVDSVQSNVTKMFSAPDGWPGNVELALIDAVLSIRAVYGTSADTGVRGAIKRYKRDSGRNGWDNLSALGGAEPAWLQEVLANRQKTGRVTKAEAIISAAARLSDIGAVHASDIDRNSAEQRRAYCGTRGLGPVTWDYFLMLVGYDGVKPDTLVTRFASEALGRKVSDKDVTRVVTEAAGRLDMPAAALDHSIWRHVSRPRKD
ncbi:hypothetical protein [Mycobacterium sp. D16R24]|jgi:hypothetical protein|uniref:hypothetical protein n=1 Tax=Mycobacterium sp. D16R24 TaxID=1855656 RepID=UPI000993B520|nr:hypothetical protein [Mycobacterium sp. D16R24]